MREVDAVTSRFETGSRFGAGHRLRVWPYVVAGVTSVLVMGLAHVALVLDGLGGYRYWPDDSEVPRDGRPHVVIVDPDEVFFVWRSTGENAPRHCAFTALPEGEPVTVRNAPSGWDRPGGAAGYEAWLAGRVATGKMAVRCDGFKSAADLYVEPGYGPRLINYYGPRWPLVVIPALVGVLLLGAAAALWARRLISHGQPLVGPEAGAIAETSCLRDVRNFLDPRL
jgi:hypothetical protein